jgi:hypothetical protein
MAVCPVTVSVAVHWNVAILFSPLIIEVPRNAVEAADGVKAVMASPPVLVHP